MLDVTQIVMSYVCAMSISYETSRYTRDYLTKNNIELRIEETPDAYILYAYKDNKKTKLTKKAFKVCCSALPNTYYKKKIKLGE